MDKKKLYQIIRKLRDEDWFIAKFGKKDERYIEGWDDCLDNIMKEIEDD